MIATQGFYTATTIRQSQLANGAISDAANLRDKVAVHDIYPGAQLTSSDFASGTANIASTLTDRQRAISLPFDSAHAKLSDLQVGDHVDIYAGFNVIPLAANGMPISGAQPRAVIRMIMPNVARSRHRQEDGGRLRERRPQGDRRASGEPGLRVGQRQALAHHPAGDGCEGIPAEHRHARDAATWRPAGDHPELARRSPVSLEQYRFLVLLDDHITDAAVRAALPPAAPVHVTSLRDARVRMGQLLERPPQTGTRRLRDVLGGGAPDVGEVAERRPETAVVMLYEGNPNGFMGPAFKAGAQDLIVLPQPTAQLTFQLEKVIARHRGPGGSGSPAPLIAILGPRAVPARR